MLQVFKKNLLSYIFYLFIAILCSGSMELLIIYIFMVLLIESDLKMNGLRQIIRVTHLAKLVQLTAIIRKNKISKETLDKILNELKNDLTEKELKDLNDDINSAFGGY